MCEGMARYIMMTAFVVSLIIHGLVSEGDVGQTRKPVSVQVSPTKSLLLDIASTAALTKQSANNAKVTPMDSDAKKAEETQVDNAPKANETNPQLGGSPTNSTTALNETVHKDDTSKTSGEQSEVGETTVNSKEEEESAAVTDPVPAENTEEKTPPESSNGAVPEKPTGTTNGTTTPTTTEPPTIPEVTETKPSPTPSTTQSSVVTEAPVVTPATKIPPVPAESSSTEPTTTTINNGTTEQSEVTEEKTDPGMSSGIIALVMAIVFAVLVILVYVGLLLWRRYLEFRYGNRELLVNDLEFDTNDLRHFEL